MFAEAKWLAEAVREWHKNTAEIARRYTAGVDRDPAFPEFMKAHTPDIPPSTWRRLEKVGRGYMDVRVVAGSVRYGNKLERLPLSEQKAILDDRVPFLLPNGDVMRLSIHEIHDQEVRQLLAFDHIRDLSGQRAWMEEQKLLEAKKKKEKTKHVEVEWDGEDFVVDGKTVPQKKLVAYIKTLLGE